mmetsp:Transcript_11892/g.15150  ORF Transcript_11892/g.15150 Transcript_11892/m.15150 type:complete len:88 (+) Transcript_11892:304-567(+)
MEQPKSLIQALDKKGTLGLLVILLDSDRAHGGYKGTLAEQERFHAFSDMLTMSRIVYPVYFTYENDDLLHWYDLLAKKDSRLDNLVV